MENFLLPGDLQSFVKGKAKAPSPHAAFGSMSVPPVLPLDGRLPQILEADFPEDLNWGSRKPNAELPVQKEL